MLIRNLGFGMENGDFLKMVMTEPLACLGGLSYSIRLNSSGGTFSIQKGNSISFFPSYRYGLLYGPLKARNLAKESADKYLQIYDILVSGNTFDSIDSVVQDIGLSGAISTSAADYYTKSKVNSLFTDEILGIIFFIYALALINFERGPST